MCICGTVLQNAPVDVFYIKHSDQMEGSICCHFWVSHKEVSQHFAVSSHNTFLHPCHFI